MVYGPIQLAMPLIERYVIDDVLLARRMTLLAPALLAYGGLWLLLEILFALMSILNNYLSERIAMHLRQRLFDHCQSLSFTYINRDHSSRLMALFSNDVPQVAGFLNGVVVTSVVSLTTLVVGVIIVVRINWQFGLAVLIIVPAVGLALLVLSRPLKRASRRSQDKAEKLTQHLQELLSGLREVAAFHQERAQRNSFFQSPASRFVYACACLSWTVRLSLAKDRSAWSSASSHSALEDISSYLARPLSEPWWPCDLSIM